MAKKASKRTHFLLCCLLPIVPVQKLLLPGSAAVYSPPLCSTDLILDCEDSSGTGHRHDHDLLSLLDLKFKLFVEITFVGQKCSF